MTLIRRLTLLLALSSLLLGTTIAFWQHESRLGQRLAEERRQLGEAERELSGVARAVRRYEEAREKIGSDGFARHEKVAVSMRLSAEELARLPAILHQAYGGEGFMLLRRFSMSWAGENELVLEMAGEKVILR